MTDPFPRGEEDYKEPPAFNVPSPVLWLILSMVAAFAVFAYVLSSDMQDEAIVTFALFPVRYFGPEGGGAFFTFPGGPAGALWTLVTYTFMHGSWVHLGANAVWLLAFGSPVARRLGTTRFLVFYFVCGIFGALTHILLYPHSIAPVIGASAAISGIMGGAARFVFLSGGPLGALGGGAQVPSGKASIGAALTNKNTLIFVGAWIGINLLFGPTGFTSALGSSAPVAWEAHIGGFLAGLLLFGFFDPVPMSPSGGPGNVGYGQWLGGGR